jgi:hypothetical protein
MENSYMVDKTFSEIAVGSQFTVNGIEYVKTDTVRVSCCQSINAHVLNDQNARVFFQDSTTVSVNA